VRGSCCKRIFDLAIALPGLILLLPLLALVSGVILVRLGRPIFFGQERAGLGGKSFRIYKFRTMTDARDRDGRLLSDRERLTPLGKFLRRTSIDELPELYNVIKGDLSLVGPRPLFMRYLPCYTEREQLRHTVKPGITGWAQIQGRNLLPWDERLALDVWYVENRSIWLDIRILLQTLVKVLTRHGVAADSDEVESDLEQERKARNAAVSERLATDPSSEGESR
jgi:sugar transferase EpsL